MNEFDLLLNEILNKNFSDKNPQTVHDINFYFLLHFFFIIDN